MNYEIFTRKFDREWGPADLTRQLGPLRAQQLSKAWETFLEHTLEWRVALDAALLKLSEGEGLQDTVATLLVDNSGSMRGANMLLALAAADSIQSFLLRHGATVEIAGFTTGRWRGGLSRTVWNLTGRRRSPGRLNDLLHIVYREAGTQVGTSAGDRQLAHMLRNDILKENVDGEALLWAASRLEARSSRRKLLVLLSDGVPMDDSTALANGVEYLRDHLAQVAAQLEERLAVGQIQLGAEWPSPFTLSAVVRDPADLSGNIPDLLGRLFVQAGVRSGD